MKHFIGIVLLFTVLSLVAAQDLDLKRGRKVYLDSCSPCHGITGKGDGIVAANLYVKPRDFTLGQYKIKTTIDGDLPLHEDLYTTLSKGMGQRNSMLAWAHLRGDDREAVLAYIKSLYPRFATDEPPQVISYPAVVPPMTAKTIRQGKTWYEGIECGKCHGLSGHGDGPSTAALRDEQGHKITPPDLNKPWLFIGGSTRMDLFRTIKTGIAGSAMPSLDGIITDDQIWELVDYLAHEFVQPGEQAPR